jgi:hypothetical protein
MAFHVVVTNNLTDDMKEAGKNVLSALDRAGMNVTACFWSYISQSERWRLIIVSPDVDAYGPLRTYEVVRDALVTVGKGVNLEDISVISPSNNMVKLLKKAIRTGVGAMSEIRFTGNIVDGVLIEDTLIYRI